MIRSRRIMGILVLSISLIVLLWGIWPQANVIRTFSANLPIENLVTAGVSPTILLTPPPPIPVTPSINSISRGIHENRWLVIELPSRLRVGDADFLRLKLVVDQQGNPSPSAVTGNEPGNETHKNPNSTASHIIIVEARLDMAGMQYTPSGEISESLHAGQPAMFLWSVRAPEVGTYRGTVWMHVRFIPLAGGEEIRSVLSAPRVEIEAINFLGLGGSAARVLGSVGIVVGSMLGLDGILSWFWSFFKSLRKSGSNLGH